MSTNEKPETASPEVVDEEDESTEIDRREEAGFNLRTVFRGISAELGARYLKSSTIAHSGGKGSSRESGIRDFLKDYLPDRYGIGNGEIVHWSNRRSRQSDTVIYDRLQCPRLLVDADHSIYPLESVYGTVEVKSVLTSKELKLAFENIVSVKRLAAQGALAVVRNGFAFGFAHPLPFGAIVAYTADRSLGAVAKQLAKLEAQLANRTHAPDVIAVLDAGLVGRRQPLRGEANDLDPKWVSAGPKVRETKAHTLLRFYLEMLRELNSIMLEPLNMMRYLNMPEILAGHRVLGHNKIAVFDAQRKPTGAVRKINEKGIKKIIEHCAAKGTVPLVKHLQDLTGDPNVRIEGVSAQELGREVYVYNPDNRRSLPDSSGAGFNPLNLAIDGKDYLVDLSALERDELVDNDDLAFDELISR